MKTSNEICSTDDAVLPPADHELRAGETVTGLVLKLPAPGAPHGNKVWLELDDGRRIALDATAKRGRAVLHRLLVEKLVRCGERITISYGGLRRTQDGERAYRHYLLVRENRRESR